MHSVLFNVDFEAYAHYAEKQGSVYHEEYIHSAFSKYQVHYLQVNTKEMNLGEIQISLLLHNEIMVLQLRTCYFNKCLYLFTSVFMSVLLFYIVSTQLFDICGLLLIRFLLNDHSSLY